MTQGPARELLGVVTTWHLASLRTVTWDTRGGWEGEACAAAVMPRMPSLPFP